MLTHKQLRAKALANAEVKAEYEKQADAFSRSDEFLQARAAQGLNGGEAQWVKKRWRLPGTHSGTRGTRARGGCVGCCSFHGGLWCAANRGKVTAHR